ncbi:MAG: glycosyltransferase [Candidatus Ancillula sp.]|jgi:undecaprenyldiphospho-muramoylpentapeptide beta-N-acetylglucosaminyltransferase|nr:glycosyltransferase [Candidatus Ancillula sp.]
MRKRNVLLAAAGTAGHVIPALETARELEQQNYHAEFLGCYGIEVELVKDAGFKLHQIDKLPLEREWGKIFRNLSLPNKLHKLIKQTETIIKQNNINAVVVFGGYVSVPAIFAAKNLKVPIIVHEQNTKVGLANRVAAMYASEFAYSFPDTILPRAARNAQLTGLPMRSASNIDSVAAGSDRSVDAPGENTDCCARRKLLVFGGSLGALNINIAVCNAAERLLDDWEIVHVTGRGKVDAALDVRTALPTEKQQYYTVLEYADNLLDLMSAADLVICRSGAGSVHELALLGKPAILVPLPIGNGEQFRNVALLGDGALTIKDADFRSDRLIEALKTMTTDRLRLMKTAAVKNAIPNATKKLVRLIERAILKTYFTTRTPKQVHFMALSGAGISPIASCFEKISSISGCDSTLGGHSPDHLIGKDMLVYSSAIKETNTELSEARRQEEHGGRIEVLHRSDVLNILLKMHKTSVAVAGSHGKTTITSMIAQILEQNDSEATSFVVGAEAKINGVHCNGGKLADRREIIVLEADESDGSFTKYYPDVAVISNLEPDHLDYYGDFDGVKREFKRFAQNAQKVVTTQEVADELGLHGRNVVVCEKQTFNLSVPGQYNQVNASLASCVCRGQGVDPQAIERALESFTGASRRFEVHEIEGLTVVDDYAHHPTEVQKLIDGAIEKYGSNDFVVLFQSHLYSRTRDFQVEFAKELERAKFAIVTKIFKAREEQADFPDVTPETIAQHSDDLLTTDSLEEGVQLAVKLARQSSKIVLSVGAGPSLVEMFRKYAKN